MSDFMRKFDKKQLKQVSLIWVASFVLAMLMYVVVISPQMQEQKQILKKLADKEKTYANLRKITQKEAAENINKQMQQWNDNIRQYVVSDHDFAALTFDISQIAKELKVDEFSIISQENFSSRKETNKYISEKQVKVSFKSGFQKFAAFMSAIERHQPVIFVTNFSITDSEHKASGCEVEMLLSVYVEIKQGT